MTSCLRIVLLGWLVIGAFAQFDLDLSDALGEDDPTVAPPKPPVKPKDTGTDDLDLDLFDALSPDPVEPKKPAAVDPVDPVVPVVPVEPKKPAGGGDPKKPAAGGADELDLFDALGPDTPEPEKPAVPPKNGGTGGAGGSFGDGDLVDIAGGAGGDYKPDGGKGRASDPAHDPNGGGAAEQPEEAGAGSIAGIASAIGVALLGAASSYFAYQKKKLCFKIQGGQDPESGKDHQGTESEPQVLSNLLSSS